MYLLSHFQAKEILDSYMRGEKSAACSLDLGITRTTITRDGNDYLFPDGQRVMVKLLTKILGTPQVCFFIEDNGIRKVQFFSDETNTFYKLFPVGPRSAPTIELSGIRMHVTKEMDPMEHARRMVKEISPVDGVVLDTCRGLGYSVIAALDAGAKKVMSLEADSVVTEVAKFNPHSDRLFSSKAVEMIDGDASVLVKQFKTGQFSRILHDPPTLALAGELYSLPFYKQLHRILASGGMLYHYTGNPGSKKRGMDMPTSVGKRLREAGFKDVRPAHYGVKAVK